MPFLAYLFRYADTRTDKPEVEKIATAFRTMSNVFSTMQCTGPLLSASHAPVAGFYSKLPQEPRDHPWPNVVESNPDGMVHAGLAMLREVQLATGFHMESALVLTTVKNIVYTLGGTEWEEQITRALPNAAMVVAWTANGQVLVHAVVKRTAEEARKLHPNNCADSPENCALPLVEILITL